MITFSPPFTCKDQDSLGLDGIVNSERVYDVSYGDFMVKCRFVFPLPISLNKDLGTCDKGEFYSIAYGYRFPLDYRVKDDDLLTYTSS